MADHPRSVAEIYEDFTRRRTGLMRALTEDVDEFYQQCDPERENLCLYGESDGSWVVDIPAEEVPPELPEPCLGINFARDGMQRKDWLGLVAVHSDAWLMAVAFYYGAKLDSAGREQLFKLINQHPTLYEAVTGRHLKTRPGINNVKRKREEDPYNSGAPTGVGGVAKSSESPLPTGRLLTNADISVALKGRKAELYWPDDKLWYLIEIQSVNVRNKTAKATYTSGEVEDLNLEEIVREGHMSLITQ